MNKKYAYIIPVGQIPDEEKGYRAIKLMGGGQRIETDWYLDHNLSEAKIKIDYVNAQLFNGNLQAANLFIIANLI